MDKLFRHLLHLAAATGLLCGVLLAWAYFVQKPYLSYTNLPFPANLQQVKPGQVMPLTVRRCSSSSTIESYTVTHSLQNLDGKSPAVIMPATLVTVEPGCAISTSLIDLVPDATPPGKYRIVGVAIIQGTLRTFPVPWWSQEFEVTK